MWHERLHHLYSTVKKAFDSPQSRLFLSKLKKGEFNPLNVALIAAMFGAFAGAYISYLLTIHLSSSNDSVAADQAKKAVALECPRMKKGFSNMVDVSKQSGMIGFNSYALPSFPQNLVSLINSNSKYYLTENPNFVTVMDGIDAADYRLTMSMRSDDGSIFGAALDKYVYAVNRICMWASDTKSDFIDLQPFGLH